MEGRTSKLESVDSMAKLSDLQLGLALGLLGMAPLQRRCGARRVRLIESSSNELELIKYHCIMLSKD